MHSQDYDPPEAAAPIGRVDLVGAYTEAWDEWHTSGEAELWDLTTADGITPYLTDEELALLERNVAALHASAGAQADQVGTGAEYVDSIRSGPDARHGPMLDDPPQSYPGE